MQLFRVALVHCIEDVKELPTDGDYSDDFYWIDFEGDYRKIEHDDLFDSLCEDDCLSNIVKIYNESEDKEIEVESISKEDLELVKQWFYSEIKWDDDLDTFAMDNIRKVYFLKEYFIVKKAPHSFFEKDALEHLASNKHHYTDKAHTYGVCQWRTDRMNRLREFLMKVEL